VMNLVSLLVLPAVIALEDNPARFAIAGLALVILGVSIAFSKRKTGGMTEAIPKATTEPMGEHTPEVGGAR
ncbi:MAG: hypothetical protein M3238_01645, partial [Actinomycetota bacterium]|nr:hypothetical protein [Actinomycetota bacterium]